MTATRTIATRGLLVGAAVGAAVVGVLPGVGASSASAAGNCPANWEAAPAEAYSLSTVQNNSQNNAMWMRATNLRGGCMVQLIVTCDGAEGYPNVDQRKIGVASVNWSDAWCNKDQALNIDIEGYTVYYKQAK